MNYIADQSGNKLAYRGLSVLPVSDTLKIKTRMNDGSYTVQQIGSAAKMLTVSFIVTDTAAMDAVCESCEPIMVYTLDKIYTGIISSTAIIWIRIAPGIKKWRGTFELTVSAEEDR